MVSDRPSEPTLTIALPTFNRCDTVVPICEAIFPSLADGAVDLLVIDDGSSDGTHEALSRFRVPGFRLLRHEVNQGYARTFVEIFEAAESQFVLVSADDDPVDLTELPRFLAWLPDSDADFICPQWISRQGALYRGRQSTGRITPAELRLASSHAPGLVYSTAAAVAALGPLKAAIDADSAAAATYPQVGLAATAIARGRASWWNGCLVREGAGFRTGIRDSKNRRYREPGSRLDQHVAFESLLADLEADLAQPEERQRMRQMRKDNAKSIYAALRTVIEATSGETGAKLVDRATARNLLLTAARRLRAHLPLP